MSYEWIKGQIESGSEKARQAADRAQRVAEFQALDKRAVLKMSDIELATWQSGFPSGSPQFIFAEHQWKVRLARKTAVFAALIAIFSGLLGAAINQALQRPVTEKTNQQTQHHDKPVTPDVKPDQNPGSAQIKGRDN